jgi:type I restriction enzyme M protein
MIASMTEQAGRVGVVMPLGALFRGGQEGRIRKCVLDKDLIEAVIGMPTNLFYSTTIPVALLIFRKNKPTERQGKVLFVDASARFKALRNQNTMSDADIDAIRSAYADGEDIDGEGGLNLRLVDLAEIAANEHDLNIGRYIVSEAATEIDVETALAAYRDARVEFRAAELALDEKLRAAGFDA